MFWAAQPTIAAPDSVALPESDRIRIAEGRRIAGTVGDKLWPGWSEAPFPVLLVTKEKEFLIGHPRPGEDFAPVAYDSLLEGNVFVRARVYDMGLLATFPLRGVPTVVIGQPKNTDASHSTRWVLTLLHEHFHQWQQSRPDYFSSVDALGLAGNDSTGMWMLNYPFPYDDKETGMAFAELARRLRDTVMAVGLRVYPQVLESYREARREFKDLLTEKDYAYFSFQVWQEGIARYTEYELARRIGVSYMPTEAFEDLADYVPFATDAENTREHVLGELMSVLLKKSRRSAFYHIGAAEGMLLDKTNPGWRSRYFDDRFFVEQYFEDGDRSKERKNEEN